jgi:hypothetical protein
MHELTSLYFQRRGALSAGNRPTARNLKTTITRIGCVAPSCDRMTVARRRPLRIAAVRPRSVRLLIESIENGARNGAREGQTANLKGEDESEIKKVGQIRQADRALLLAHAERF